MKVKEKKNPNGAISLDSISSDDYDHDDCDQDTRLRPLSCCLLALMT